ncbi:SPFH domain-containing protein [Maritalea sp.]|jgi:regulator of protease activity HflC (stomatin/prohibitin superfamily)|uniref:SPFH domain-containing protein n=1 Tax=Maritalea sp. TaxID=2003361 RepID=UPI0039E34E9D
MKEKLAWSISGYPMVGVILIWAIGMLYLLTSAIIADGGPALIVPPLIVGPIIAALLIAGFVMVQPKQSRVLVLFGAYNGTLKQEGLRWVNPFNSPRIPISLRLRNFESGKNKVNDANGNPIEIAAIVVWKVIDTAEATFEVDNYQDFVAVQSEAAVRTLASRYAYDMKDSKNSDAVSLRANPAEISEMLKQEIQDRLQTAGVEVVEARISHLAYAQEIAAAMLQRQQASAIVDAREIIVEGAVGMVELALAQLSERKIVELDDERKAAMVGNLLVVLCGQQDTQPVVNAGSLY